MLSDEQSLYQSQVKGRYNSPAHQGGYISEVLAGQTIRQILTEASKVVPLQPSDPLAAILDRFDQTSRVVLPVADVEGKLLGVIHLNEVYWTSHRKEALPWLLAEDLMYPGVQAMTVDDSLERAVELYAEGELPELPVIEDIQGRKLVGMLKRTEVARAYIRRVHAQVTPVGDKLKSV